MMKKLKLGLVLLLVGCLLCVGLSSVSATDVVNDNNSTSQADLYDEWLSLHEVEPQVLILDNDFSCKWKELNLDEEMESNNIESTNAMQATSSELILDVDSFNDTDVDISYNVIDCSVISYPSFESTTSVIDESSNSDSSSSEEESPVIRLTTAELPSELNCTDDDILHINSIAASYILIDPNGVELAYSAAPSDVVIDCSAIPAYGFLQSTTSVIDDSDNSDSSSSEEESPVIRLTTLREATANMNTVSDNVTFNDEPVIITTGEPQEKGKVKNSASALVDEPVIITTTSSSAEDTPMVIGTDDVETSEEELDEYREYYEWLHEHGYV